MSEPIEIDDEIPTSSTKDPQEYGEENPQDPSEPERQSGSEQSNHSTKSLSTLSLASIDEHSRNYANTTYPLPSDSDESTRLTILHQCLTHVLPNALTLSHIPPTATRILDIGTGPADWAVAIAERFPDAEVIATDITTAMQPASAPRNLFFELDDAEREWAYNEGFDFIHIRGLTGAFTSWERIYAEAAKHLKPGGYLEVADLGEITIRPDHPNKHTTTYNTLIRTAAALSPRPSPLSLSHLQPPFTALSAAHLTVIKSKSFTIPLLSPKQPVPPQLANDQMKILAGKMALCAALEGLESVGLRLLTRYLGWGEEEVRALCEEVREEVKGSGGSVEWRVVVGRKMGV